MQQYLQNRNGLVENVFNKVYDKYDLMNDFMSLGIHRIWKKNLLNWMNPSSNKILADVACGTGDIGKLYLDFTNKDNKIFCIDPNRNMIEKGRNKLKKYKNIKWMVNSAEKLSLKENSCDYYTISFGLRNTENLNHSISEAYRVLKPGGRFLCLEFSKVKNEILNKLYQTYSKSLPRIGKIVVGKSEPYEYLIESIEKFHSQEEFFKQIEKQNFTKISYRNLSGGIVAIHSAWKV